MLMNGLRRCVAARAGALALLAMVSVGPVQAQTTLRAEAVSIPPLSMEQDGRWTGFSIELREDGTYQRIYDKWLGSEE